MANAINIPKSHLIMGLSLPLAVLLGYFVAEPMELGSLAVVVFVLVVLSIPLMLKWYYVLLVLSWRAAFSPAFIPGHLPFWSVVASIGLLFAVLSRAVSANARFVVEPSINKSLLALVVVVVATGLMTGGFGLAMLGSGHYGGKHYFYLLAAVAGYYVLTSRRIPPHRAGLYVALFFLSALTFTVSELGFFTGRKLDFLWLLFPNDAMSETALQGPLVGAENLVRFNSLAMVGEGLCCYLLARFGLRGLLDLTRPGRLLLLLLALGAGLLSGFRVFVILTGLTFAAMFYLEGLHRTRYLPALLGVALLGSIVVLPRAEKLPLPAQRALSFLPGNYSYVASQNAQGSLNWRLGMWEELLPEVPKCLFHGKGWAIEVRDYTDSQMGDPGNPLAGAIAVGNYHNGPLSVLIAFGLYGAVAFIWFLAAGLRVLHRNWKFGNPALRKVNTVLLAVFAAQTVFFVFVFGALDSDLAVFTGVLGLGVALNGADTARARAEEPATGVAFNTEYIKA